jgi:hypothetical protein
MVPERKRGLILPVVKDILIGFEFLYGELTIAVAIKLSNWLKFGPNLLKSFVSLA